MRNNGSEVRNKILWGYILIALVCIFAFIYIYKTIVLTALGTDTEQNPMYEKSMLIGSALSSLYEVEYDGNRLIQSASPNAIVSYRKRVDSLNAKIDSLKKKDLSKEQQIVLGDIEALLLKKKTNMNELIYLSKTFRDGKSYRKIIDEIVAGEKESYATDLIVKTNITYNTIVQEPPKENFWKRLGHSFRPRSVDTIWKLDSVTTYTDTLKRLENRKDSLKKVFHTVKEKVALQNEINNNILKSKLNTILYTNQKLSNQIQLLLNELNREAVVNSLEELEKKRASLQELTRVIIAVAIAAVLIVCIFLFLIFTDLHKGQEYKRRLEEARKYAEDLMQSRHRLLLNISHDIKAPLCSITGYLDLLGNSTDKTIQKYSTSMRTSTNYIMDLLGNLLEYARLGTGKTLIQQSVFNLRELFEDLVESFMPLTKAKGLDLFLEIEEMDENVFVEGDRIRIRQILMNLLSNAVKFTDRGEIRIICEMEKVENENDVEKMLTKSEELGMREGEMPNVLLKLRITDTGCGIAENKIENVFDEFLRVESEDRRWREGNGLGLAVVKGAVNLLGGSIEVSSKVGEGSCFSLVLPLGLAGKACEIIASRPYTDKIDGRSLSVLVVDDDVLQLAMVREMLSLRGYEVFCATNMQAVSEVLASEEIHLILTDLQMENFTGYVLLENIKKSMDEKVRSIPVVAVSASEVCSMVDLKTKGFDDFMKKPFSLANLLELVDRYAFEELCSSKSFGVAHSSQIDCLLVDESKDKGNDELDLTSLEEMMEGDMEAVEGIVNLFKESVRENIGLIEVYIEEQRYKEIKDLCHKMLPMFLQLGLKDIGGLLARVDGVKEDELASEEMNLVFTEIVAKARKLVS